MQLKENFTPIDLSVALKLKSTSSIKLYELLIQYASIGKRKFKVLELKKLLGVQDNYSLYGDFKRYVLKKAKKDFEKHGDISFELTEQKKDRKVDILTFKIIRLKPNL